MDKAFIDTLDKAAFANTYPGLCTLWECEGDKHVEQNSYSCFGNLLKKIGNIKMHNVYKIYMRRDPDPAKYSRNNLCLFTLEEVEEYLGMLTKIYPFTFNVEEVTKELRTNGVIETTKVIAITLDLDGTHLFHTFILTCIRYLYETQYMYVLSEALRLKKEPEFRKINIINLMNVVLFTNTFRCSNDMSHWDTNYYPKALMTSQAIKERIEYLTEAAERKECVGGIIDIFPSLNIIRPEITHNEYINDYYKKHPFYAGKYLQVFPSKGYHYDYITWALDDEDYKENRLPAYKNNLLLIASVDEATISRAFEEKNEDLEEFYYGEDY